MNTTVLTPGVGAARALAAELCEALGIPVPRVARPGADLRERSRRGMPWPGPGTLLPTVDGWVHPGPTTAWPAFVDMVCSLGAPPPRRGDRLPDVRGLSAEAIDAEAGIWRLPAAAVRATALAPKATVPVPPAGGAARIASASVVVLGTAWAVPLGAWVLARQGARVTKIEDPRREDPFPLRDALAAGQTRVAVDFRSTRGFEELGRVLARADLLVDGNTPRVLANIGLDDAGLRELNPRLSMVRLAAFAAEDRPGYGLAAECRGGWAARSDPPRLGRTSLADPIAGLLLVYAAIDALAAAGARRRASLEDAVQLLVERARGA